MKSIFRYPGGKTKLLTPIIDKLTLLNTGQVRYSEPFFGGGSVGLKFLQISNFKNAWINDKDMGIACLWTAIFNYPELLKNKIQEFQPDLEQFYTFKSKLLDYPIPETPEQMTEIGFMKLAVHQMSYSGLGVKSGPIGGRTQTSSTYKLGCRWSSTGLIKKIFAVRDSIKNVRLAYGCCSCWDFEKILNDDGVSTLTYLDPPYYVKGNQLYQHGFSLEDHARLAESLKNTKHTWLLSYDDCEEIRKLYRWARVEEVVTRYTLTVPRSTDGKRTAGKIKELLISA